MSSRGKLLIFDAGNTVLKAARFEGDTLLDVTRIDYTALEEGLVPLRSWGAEAAVLSSVSHLTAAQLSPWVGLEVLDFNASTPMPIRLVYNTPATLGADRLANACGGAALHPGQHQLIIDIGTCITSDLLEAGEVFHGGAISPGIRLRSAAMHQYTARLPQVQVDGEVPHTGRSTAESLQSGIYYGILDEIRGRAARYRKKFPDLVVVITGGDSVYFEKGLECPIFAHPNLTLVGLHEILCTQLESR